MDWQTLGAIAGVLSFFVMLAAEWNKLRHLGLQRLIVPLLVGTVIFLAVSQVPVIVVFLSGTPPQTPPLVQQSTQPAPQLQPTSTPEVLVQPTPTFTRIPPTRMPTVRATATPRPYIKEYVIISPQRETRHITLAAGELLVGTAVYFQDNFNQKLPPFTVFMIRGPVEMDVTIENGGWDYWANVYDDEFAESLLAPKIAEVQSHPDYSIRGHRIVRLP
jgi:hypothetical protein